MLLASEVVRGKTPKTFQNLSFPFIGSQVGKNGVLGDPKKSGHPVVNCPCAHVNEPTLAFPTLRIPVSVGESFSRSHPRLGLPFPDHRIHLKHRGKSSIKPDVAGLAFRLIP